MKYCLRCKAKYDDRLDFCAVDGGQLSNDPDELLGTILDQRYQIEEFLGHGAMGTVYVARHIVIGDRVAIKTLLPQKQHDAKWLRRFQREAQALRRLNHPNAVTVHDLGTTQDGSVFLVMELVKGHTLAAQLKSRGRFTLVEAFQILAPMMDVLAAAHEVGVIHRDFKPENVMVGESIDGDEVVVKLIDFGVVKFLKVQRLPDNGKTAVTGHDEWVGTPYYMAPEQRGIPSRDGLAEIDGRADLYALAVVFYELIWGSRPVVQFLPADLGEAPSLPRAQLLHELVPEVPPEFSLEIARAMSLDRADRHANMRDFANRLRSLLDAIPSHELTQTPAAHPSCLGQPQHWSNEPATLPMTLETPMPEQDVMVAPEDPPRASRPASPLEQVGDLNIQRTPDQLWQVNLQVGGLQTGEVFYLLNFFRNHLQHLANDLALLAPFVSLFEPEVHTGFPKWISIVLENQQLVLKAYPKPVRLDSSGKPRQYDEVVLSSSHPIDSFEYWPDGAGNGHTRFFVELHFGEPARIRMHEIDKPEGPVLEVDLFQDGWLPFDCGDENIAA